MQLFLKQFPIVVQSLNIGFLQTMKLFFVTLLGAIPLGLVIALGSMSRVKPLSALTRVVVWIVRGSPLMIQLLIIFYFPGIVLGNPIWSASQLLDFFGHEDLGKKILDTMEDMLTSHRGSLTPDQGGGATTSACGDAFVELLKG